MKLHHVQKDTTSAHCRRSQSPWCRWVLTAPVQVGRLRSGPNGAELVPSEWTLCASWGGAEGGGGALGREQCHVSEGLD